MVVSTCNTQSHIQYTHTYNDTHILYMHIQYTYTITCNVHITHILHTRAHITDACIHAPPPAGMANRTTLVDNNTWNNSHIALVGKAMSSTEEKAYKIMRMLGVDYVLVIFGGMIGYSGDDINKFLWMVRIAEGEHPQDIKVGVVRG